MPNLPNSQYACKRLMPRYHMQRLYKELRYEGNHGTHAHLRITPADVGKWYNPLDLFSADAKRIEKAVQALTADWTHDAGHMRVFIDGKCVTYTQAKKHVPHIDTDEGLRMFARRVTNTLMESENQALLTELKWQQERLDPYDIEGIAAIWRHVTGTDLATVPLNVLPKVALSDYMWIALHAVPSVILPRSSSGDAEVGDANATEHRMICEPRTLRYVLAAYLLAATLKDVTLFVPLKANAASRRPVSVVDLDAKRVSKLQRHVKQDNAVAVLATQWLQKADMCAPRNDA